MVNNSEIRACVHCSVLYAWSVSVIFMKIWGEKKKSTEKESKKRKTQKHTFFFLEEN